MTSSTISPAFEVSSKRRKGFPSETRVKRGLRFVRGGEKELVEKLGRNDPCPCGSGKSFQAVLPALRPVRRRGKGGVLAGVKQGGPDRHDPDRFSITAARRRGNAGGMSRLRSLLPIACLPALAGCDLYSCGNLTLRTVPAPDGRHAAAIFQRDCGATDEFSIQVSLVSPGETPVGSGDVFVPGGERRAPRVEWLGPDRLRIGYWRDSPPLRRERGRDGVRIEYRDLGIDNK